MSVLIQDGRRGGHLKWALQAVGAGQAEGAIISPFHTPRVKVPRHIDAGTVVANITGQGGEALFDPSTHAALLPGSNDVTHYDTWQLWGPAGKGLNTDARRFEHVERVFDRQKEIAAPAFAPTLTLDSPLGQNAVHAFRTAQIARGLDRDCWQPLAGRRSFWNAGPDLDAYVGQLAALRAPFWALTVTNDVIADNAPDLADTSAFTGLLRTVHSLSKRSRVVVLHSDYAGVPAIAAGADTLGTGWDRGMRYFDPRSFQLTSAGIQIPASYVTQGRLGAVLRRDAGDAITRLDSARATLLRGGPMPANDTAERAHHLHQLHALVNAINSHGISSAGRMDRVRYLREFYEDASRDFGYLISNLPSAMINATQRKRWIDNPYAVLKNYATAEGLW